MLSAPARWETVEVSCFAGWSEVRVIERSTSSTELTANASLHANRAPVVPIILGLVCVAGLVLFSYRWVPLLELDEEAFLHRAELVRAILQHLA